MTRIGLHAMLVLAALLLAGCTAPTTIDASDPKALDASLQRMSTQTHGDKKALGEAAAFFRQQYFTGTPGKGLPDWRAVHKMTELDFLRFVAKLRERAAPLPTARADYPEADVTLGYLHSLDMEIALLQERRTFAHRENRYTIDQFQWAQPFFTAPKPMDPILESRATFQLSFTNKTDFDIYPPTLHLTVTKPGSRVPLYDADLQTDHIDTIKPGVPTLLTYYCCSLLEHPDDNKVLRTLPGSVALHYAITEIHDYTKVDQLDHRYFTLAEYTRMVDAKACAADIRKRVDSWTPGQAILPCTKQHVFRAVYPYGSGSR